MPAGVASFFAETAGMAGFTIRFFKQVWRPRYEWREIMHQCYEVGNRSLGLVAITGFIMGLVLTIQSRPTLADFGAESMLPGMVSISLIREIAPVITSLICAGRIGSGMGAELGSMRVTEQIDAMEVSGINPFKYLVVSRILAATLMVPVLVIFADAVGILGGWVGVNIKSEVSGSLYISDAFSALSFSDLLPATVKTFFFGFAIGLVGTYKGYNAENGTEGVGQASNTAVVAASLLVFVLDMIAVQITDVFYS